jgi:hypothetical protein
MNQQEQTPWIIYVVILVIALWVTLKIVRYALRRKYLIGKYGQQIGIRLLKRHVWQGMTIEQLSDSWGNPVDIDRVVYKTKTKETWKYNQTGKNRFRNRIYVENGMIVGWKD